MKNSPVGKLPLKQNPFKRLPVAQPSNFAAPSFDDNSEERNQGLLENTPPQTNLPEKPSSEERTNEQQTSSQASFPEREDQSNEYSGIEIVKASQGMPQSSSESGKAPKKNKMHLPPLQKTLKFQQTDEEASPSRDSGFTPLMRSPDTEREPDKSPASARPLFNKTDKKSKTPKNEAKSGKKESAFKRAVTGVTRVTGVARVTGMTGATRVTPEQEIELVQPDKKTRSKSGLLNAISSKKLRKFTNVVKDGALSLIGKRQESETSNAGDDDDENNEEFSSLTNKKTLSVKRFGVIKGKTLQPKRFFGLGSKEEKSVKYYYLFWF